jgi:hypothetical protein
MSPCVCDGVSAAVRHRNCSQKLRTERGFCDSRHSDSRTLPKAQTNSCLYFPCLFIDLSKIQYRRPTRNTKNTCKFHENWYRGNHAPHNGGHEMLPSSLRFSLHLGRTVCARCSQNFHALLRFSLKSAQGRTYFSYGRK